MIHKLRLQFGYLQFAGLTDNMVQVSYDQGVFGTISNIEYTTGSLKNYVFYLNNFTKIGSFENLNTFFSILVRYIMKHAMRLFTINFHSIKQRLGT